MSKLLLFVVNRPSRTDTPVILSGVESRVACTVLSKDSPPALPRKSALTGIMKVFGNKSQRIGPVPSPAIALQEELMANGQIPDNYNSNDSMHGADMPQSLSSQGISSLAASTVSSKDSPPSEPRKSALTGIMKVFGNKSQRSGPVPNPAVSLQEELNANERALDRCDSQDSTAASTVPSKDSPPSEPRKSALTGILKVFGNKSQRSGPVSNPAVALQEELNANERAFDHCNSQDSMHGTGMPQPLTDQKYGDKSLDESRKLSLIAVARRDAAYRARVVHETWLVNKTETTRTKDTSTEGSTRMWSSQSSMELEHAARKQAVSMMHDDELYKPVESTELGPIVSIV